MKIASENHLHFLKGTELSIVLRRSIVFFKSKFTHYPVIKSSEKSRELLRIFPISINIYKEFTFEEDVMHISIEYCSK